MKRIIVVTLFAACVLAFAGCSSSDSASPSNSAASGSSAEGAVTLRLGYFPNITHAQALVGLARGTYSSALGPNVQLKTTTFNAGPAAIEALFAGDIDATYMGPNPAINGYLKSDGEALRVVAGAASGGALLVVRPDANIKSAKDLDGKKIATPQLGNTQDVALRNYLSANGLGAKESGGNVQVLPMQNSDTLNLFMQGDIDGAWVPEPWATRLVKEAGGQKAHVETTQWINANPEEAKKVVNDGIKQVAGAGLSADVVDAAWQHLKFTYDPIASSLRSSADAAYKLGFLTDKPDLSNIYALDTLNKVLQAQNLPTVQS